MKLTKRLETLLMYSVSQSGWEPEEAMLRIEEQLTGDEYEAGFAFLTWICEGIANSPEDFPGRRFGRNNMKEQFAKFLKDSKKVKNV